MSQSKDSRISFARLAGIRTAFLNAPMPGAATPELVAAVSEAGGLGVIPAAPLTPEEIHAFADRVKSLTKKPFAVTLTVPSLHKPVPEDFTRFADAISLLLAELGLPDGSDGKLAEHYDLTLSKVPDFASQFDAAMSCGARAVISSFGGFREPEAERLEDAGILNIGCATTLREAKVLRAAGVDAVVVQGAEAGGPRLSFEDSDKALVGLSALLPAAAAATGLPVIAAGGIAVPAQTAGLAAMGASGVMVGTALLGVRESGAPEVLKRASRYATAADTVLSRIYTGRLCRILGNGLADALADWENMTAGYPGQQALMMPLHQRAEELGREDLMMLPLGQSAGRSAYATAATCTEALGLREA